jgi:hypothetical protein
MLPSPRHGVKCYNVTNYYICKWEGFRLLKLKVQCFSEILGIEGYNETDFRYNYAVTPWYLVWNILFQADETNYDTFYIYGRNNMRKWTYTVVKNGMPMEFNTEANKQHIDKLLERTKKQYHYAHIPPIKDMLDCLQLAKDSMYDLRAFHYKFQKDNLIRCIRRVGL